MKLMKAILKAGPQPGLAMREVAVPRVTSHGVLIRVRAASICGSDLHLNRWDDWAQNICTTPRVIGHEGTGEVVEVGPQVERIRVGDHVSIEGHIPCLACPRCRTGEMHLCEHLKMIGFTVDGCFADYVLVPEICCVKNDKSLPWEIASIQDPLGNAVHAVGESKVAGKTVAIFGDGPTGLFAAAVARSLGAREIFAVGVSPFRLRLMEGLHPDHLIDATKNNPVEIILDQTRGEGCDVVLEMSGAEKAIHDGLRSVRNGGDFTAFGIPSKPVTLDLAKEIILKGVRVRGIFGRRMFETWEEMGRLLSSGRLDVSSIITHRFPMDEIDKALELLTKEPISAGKIVLIP